MKVRCIKLINPQTGRSQSSSPWLSISKIYHVLSLSCEPTQICNLRLIGDDLKTPTLHDIRLFEVTSPLIPPTWRINLLGNGYFELTPERWGTPGFWTSYFDRDPEAIRIFEEESKKIVESDP